jgi:thiosulfate/3-mercaptopyruvate sulfurtransferase
VIDPVVSTIPASTDRRVVVADVRWYLDRRSGRDAYESSHIPGAVWIDLDNDLAAHDHAPTDGRHPFPSSEHFAAAMSARGINNDCLVIAYDDAGGLSAGRLVVMLRMLGVDAALLDGGFTAWTGPTEQGWNQPNDATFSPVAWPAHRLASADDVAAHDDVVIDARSFERFSGEVTQVDPRSGHIPGARCATWSAVLDATSRFLSPDALRKHFAALGITATSDPIAYCGSGVSACMNIIGAERAGVAVPRLFVASWSGWSSDPDRPAALGR